MKGSGAAAAAAVAAAPAIHNWAFAEQIQKLEKEGWTKHPVAPALCAAPTVESWLCAKKASLFPKKRSEFFPNPGHIPSVATADVLQQLCGFGTIHCV